MTRAVTFAVLCLAACTPAPKSPTYYEEHPAEAEEVLRLCRDGRTRGEECEAARAGTARLQAQRRLDLFREGFD